MRAGEYHREIWRASTPCAGRHEIMRDEVRTGPAASLPPKAIEVDLSLHTYLGEGLGNSLLSAAYAANRIRIAVIQHARPFLADRIASAMDEHLAVIEALETRNEAAAVQALKYHCEQTFALVGCSLSVSILQDLYCGP